MKTSCRSCPGSRSSCPRRKTRITPYSSAYWIAAAITGSWPAPPQLALITVAP